MIGREAVLAALAEPVRIQILEILLRQRMRAGELAARVGVSPGTLTHHLAILDNVGLLECSKEGRVKHCQVSKRVSRRQGSMMIRTESIRITLHPER